LFHFCQQQDLFGLLLIMPGNSPENISIVSRNKRRTGWESSFPWPVDVSSNEFTLDMHSHAAIHTENLTGDIAGFRGTKESNGRGHLLGGPKTSQGRDVQHGLFLRVR
jgi:hypothetical protein